MRVMVTGGAGYIGSVLVRMLLERGHDVVVLDRLFFGRDSLKDIEDKIEIIQDDIRWFDPSILNGVDAVMDLAAISNDPSSELNPENTVDINYRGRARVAMLAKEHGVKKYILASSCSIYGFSNETLNEDNVPNPITVYAKSAWDAEKAALGLSDDSFSVTCLRQATVYGLSPKMRFDLPINGMVSMLINKGEIPVMGDGTQWRPFVHVKDTSRAFMEVLESDPEKVNGHVFNVGSNDQVHQMIDVAKMSADATGLDHRIAWHGDIDKRNYKVDFSKIKDTINFVPKFRPSDGAKEINDAIMEGLVKEEPKTITVKWYKHLMESQAQDVMINGVLL